MKIKTTLMASTAALLVLSGAAFAASPMAGETLAADQTFTYQDIDESPSIDPGMVEDVSGSAVARNLFEGLMNQDADGNLIPGVATGYDISDDKLTYTFHLRDNAKWSNGDPVIAGDFVYAWRRAADPATASPYAWFVTDITGIVGAGAVGSGDAAPETLGVEAPDDRTLVVHLERPVPYFAQTVTHATMFPVHQATVEAHGAEWTRPENIVGNGAYVLTEHVPQERMVMERNANYWNDAETVINKVVRLIINDETQAFTRWQAGELDLVGVPSGQYLSLKEQYPAEIYSNPRLCTYYYNFNVRADGPEWAQDVRVRQALNLGFDRSVITEGILQAGQIPAYTFTPPTTAGFTVPVVEAAAMTQDERTAKAKALLEEAGYGSDNPINLEILYNTSEGHKSIAIAISQMWKENLGIEATINNMEWGTFLEARGAGQFEISRAGWCGDYNEASTFLDLYNSGSGYNDAGYNSAEVDALLAEAKTAEDPQPLYTQVETIAAADAPIIPIYFYTSVGARSASLKGWPDNNVENNWYARDLYKVE